jgi:hypothetical protein
MYPTNQQSTNLVNELNEATSVFPLRVNAVVKLSLFAGIHEAAENIAMFYSFFSTCKKLQIQKITRPTGQSR